MFCPRTQAFVDRFNRYCQQFQSSAEVPLALADYQVRHYLNRVGVGVPSREEQGELLRKIFYAIYRARFRVEPTAERVKELEVGHQTQPTNFLEPVGLRDFAARIVQDCVNRVYRRCLQLKKPSLTLLNANEFAAIQRVVKAELTTWQKQRQFVERIVSNRKILYIPTLQSSCYLAEGSDTHRKGIVLLGIDQVQENCAASLREFFVQWNPDSNQSKLVICHRQFFKKSSEIKSMMLERGVKKRKGDANYSEQVKFYGVQETPQGSYLLYERYPLGTSMQDRMQGASYSSLEKLDDAVAMAKQVSFFHRHGISHGFLDLRDMVRSEMKKGEDRKRVVNTTKIQDYESVLIAKPFDESLDDKCDEYFIPELLLFPLIEDAPVISQKKFEMDVFSLGSCLLTLFTRDLLIGVMGVQTKARYEALSAELQADYDDPLMWELQRAGWKARIREHLEQKLAYRMLERQEELLDLIISMLDLDSSQRPSIERVLVILSGILEANLPSVRAQASIDPPMQVSHKSSVVVSPVVPDQYFVDRFNAYRDELLTRFETSEQKGLVSVTRKIFVEAMRASVKEQMDRQGILKGIETEFMDQSASGLSTETRPVSRKINLEGVELRAVNAWQSMTAPSLTHDALQDIYREVQPLLAKWESEQKVVEQGYRGFKIVYLPTFQSKIHQDRNRHGQADAKAHRKGLVCLSIRSGVLIEGFKAAEWLMPLSFNKPHFNGLLIHLTEDTYDRISENASRIDLKRIPVNFQREVNNCRAIAELNMDAPVRARAMKPYFAEVTQEGDAGDLRLHVFMRYGDRGSLYGFLQGANTVEQLLSFYADIALQLATFHKRGFVYGDVKPSNMVLDRLKEGRIADGVRSEVARLIDFDSVLQVKRARFLPIGGTIMLAAPECYEQATRAWRPALSLNSDVFSFGASLMLQLFGQYLDYVLFDTSNISRAAYSDRLYREMQTIEGRAKLEQAIKGYVLKQAAIKFDKWNSGKRDRLAGLILQMLALDPDKRPSAQAVFEELEAILKMVEEPELTSHDLGASYTICAQDEV